MKWKLLKYFYPNEAWGDPDKMNFMLLVLMDYFRASVPQGCKVKIHRGWSPDNPKSLHYLAKAVDFHVIGCGFLDAEYHLKNFLIRRGLMKEVELGIYPDWNDPGFHLGIQANGGTWAARYRQLESGRTEQYYIGYREGLDYAKKKFKVI
jgi:hypothetical protein